MKSPRIYLFFKVRLKPSLKDLINHCHIAEFGPAEKKMFVFFPYNLNSVEVAPEGIN